MQPLRPTINKTGRSIEIVMGEPGKVGDVYIHQPDGTKDHILVDSVRITTKVDTPFRTIIDPPLPVTCVLCEKDGTDRAFSMLTGRWFCSDCYSNIHGELEDSLEPRCGCCGR